MLGTEVGRYLYSSCSIGELPSHCARSQSAIPSTLNHVAWRCPAHYLNIYLSTSSTSLHLHAPTSLTALQRSSPGTFSTGEKIHD